MPNSILAQDVPGSETWAPHEWGNHLTCPLPMNVSVAMGSISNYCRQQVCTAKAPRNASCAVPLTISQKQQKQKQSRHPSGGTQMDAGQFGIEPLSTPGVFRASE